MPNPGMYSSKAVHAYSGVKYLGGTYIDPYKREGKSDRYQGKQFVVAHPKSGNIAQPGVLFSQATGGKSEPYKEGTKYIDQFPLAERKLGFGIKDAPKQGEFLSTIRAEQYKESMKGDEKMMKERINRAGPIEKQIDALYNRLAEIDSTFDGVGTTRNSENDFAGAVPVRGYDIGREDHGTTPANFSTGSDRFYSHKRCIQSNKPRHVQKTALSSTEYGHSKWNHPNGDRTITMDTKKGAGKSNFNDTTHLYVSSHHD